MSLAFEDGPVGDMEREAILEGLPLWLEARRGWLYLAGNQSWGGLFKIGCTRRGVEQRLSELGGAGLPTPWYPVATWFGHDAYGLEARAHAACAAWRFRGELFQAPSEALRGAIDQVLQADRTLLLAGLRSVFLPGRLEQLLELPLTEELTAEVPSYTS